MVKRIIVIVLIIGLVVTVGAINRSVYKILLAQNGYAQFVQYDVGPPPLQEFTFCTWLRVYDLSDEQTIFTYVVNGEKQVIVRLASGGTKLKISIARRSFASVPVNLTKDNWSHLCLSYQSDFGALALYLDSRIVTCEAKRALEGLILPGGGSIIVGYGTTHSGTGASGLKGEIFGVNMILLSTIEKNDTIEKISQYYQQKPFAKNKLKDYENKIQYVVLDELASNNDNQNHYIRLKSTRRPPIQSSISNKVYNTSPYSAYRFLDPDVGIDISSVRPTSKENSNEIEIVEYMHKGKDTKSHVGKRQMSILNVVNKAGQVGKSKTRSLQNTDTNKITEIFSSGTQDLPTISILETPPPPGPPNQEFYEKGLEMIQPPSEPTLISSPANYTFTNMEQKEEIIDMEPPPPQTDAEVFGQWSGSKFAGSVLNYLKNINFSYQKPKKIPRLSDSLPYASDSRISTKIIAPPILQRRKFVDQGFNIIKKRQLTNAKVINVHILEDDLRERIMRSHAETEPIKVEITNRGTNKNNMDYRRYRNIDYSEDIPKFFEGDALKLNLSNSSTNHKITQDSDIYNTNHLFTILPLITPVEYAEDEMQQSTDPKPHQFSDIYKNIIANGNKWHNIKTYNNDYTPRHINMRPHEAGIDNATKSQKKSNNNNLNENRKYMYDTERDKYISYGRALAQKVSLYDNIKEMPIFKYNDGYLPGRFQQLAVNEATHELPFKNKNQENTSKDSFDKPVKIGNALNEIHLVGLDEKEKKNSFVGGDDKVPDINRYRSDIEPGDNEDVPASLSLRECKQDNNDDHGLFVQADSSVTNTDKMSPIELKNKAIEFIMTNYKICSLEGFILNKSSLLLINWNKTPVRLFGGAIPKKTKDLCGFF